MKELDKILERLDYAMGQDDSTEIQEKLREYFRALEKELKYSKAMLADQIKKKKGISKRYGELLKEIKSKE